MLQTAEKIFGRQVGVRVNPLQHRFASNLAPYSHDIDSSSVQISPPRQRHQIELPRAYPRLQKPENIHLDTNTSSQSRQDGEYISESSQRRSLRNQVASEERGPFTDISPTIRFSQSISSTRRPRRRRANTSSRYKRPISQSITKSSPSPTNLPSPVSISTHPHPITTPSHTLPTFPIQYLTSRPTDARPSPPLLLHGRKMPRLLHHHDRLLARPNRRHLRRLLHRALPAHGR